MIIPYASHAPLHAAPQSSHSSCLIKPRAHQITLLSLALFFFNVFFECSAKCWLKMFHLCCNVLSLVPACLFDAASSWCCALCEALRMFLRGLSLTRCYQGRDGLRVPTPPRPLRVTGRRGWNGEEPTSLQTKAGNLSNNWQVALETDQLICMR